MFFVIAATSRSPARSWTRGASLKTNGRRTSRLLLSVGRFFVDRVAKPHLPSMDYPCEHTAQMHRQTFRSIGEIQHGLPIASFELAAARVGNIRNFQDGLANAQARARGNIVLMQVEIHDQIVASEVHAFGSTGNG